MPVSHIGVTVSDLASSQEFYEKVLSPLGYHVIRKDRDQVAFGVTDPDFFLCQDSSRGWPSGTHIAFAAQSASEVDKFYRVALGAGGRPFRSPKRWGTGEAADYTASIIDIDNNAVEVTSSIVASRDITQTHQNSQSETGPGILSRVPLQAIVNNIAANMVSSEDSNQSTLRPESKTVVGTLLGAAAGAAIAYAMSKDETPMHATHEPGIREVTVRHTVEYRHTSSRDAISNASVRAGSKSSTYQSPRTIEPPRSEYSIESVHSSRAPPRSRPPPLALPAPPSPPSLPGSHALPPSDRSQQGPPSSRANSYPPHAVPLPPSTRISTISYQQPEDTPLPASNRTSTASNRHPEGYSPSSIRSSTIRSPRDIPLPPSTRTSFLSHPPSSPRSDRSEDTPSTVRPLTTRNVARMNTGGGSDEGGSASRNRRISISDRGRSQSWDDLGTVVPEDSISQVSERPRRNHRDGHERREKKRDIKKSKTVSSAGRSPLVTGRSSVKVFGLGG